MFEDLYASEVYCTGTFRADRRDIPDEVKNLKEEISGCNIEHGTGYYIHFEESPVVYTCWRDTRPVCVMSTAYPGHFENTVLCKKVDKASGTLETFDLL